MQIEEMKNVTVTIKGDDMKNINEEVSFYYLFPEKVTITVKGE